MLPTPAWALYAAILGMTASGAGRPEGKPAPSGQRSPSARAGLKGKWARTDGGYVLDIKSVREDGTLDAAYFNPRPIHVARAQARVADGQIRLLVLLQDQGYPNCTYTLTYDAAGDRLAGVYYQAALRQSYPVIFVRLP